MYLFLMYTLHSVNTVHSIHKTCILFPADFCLIFTYPWPSDSGKSGSVSILIFRLLFLAFTFSSIFLVLLITHIWGNWRVLRRVLGRDEVHYSVTLKQMRSQSAVYADCVCYWDWKFIFIGRQWALIVKFHIWKLAN